jgi:MFS family permease
MQLVAPEILSEAHGLSVGLSAAGLAIGFLLWVWGWRGHRFWIVLFTTAVAGTFGVVSLESRGVQPLVAGLLLALAAGILALAVVRIIAFAAGGGAAWLAVQALAPTWQEPLVAFLAGGLLGVLLFRVWMMALTSLAGSVLMAYSGLCLADTLGKLDAVALMDKSGGLVNGGCIGVAVLGLIVQFLMDRRRARKLRERADEERNNRYHHQDRTWWNKEPVRRAG